jgi:hypothetical protein
LHHAIVAITTIALATACAGRHEDEMLLLAYGSGEPGESPGAAESYRTMALRIDGGSARIVADVPGVLVPDDSGFVVLDVATACVRDTSIAMENYSQQVRRYRFGTTAPESGSCVPLPDTTVCDDDRARITFASREVWAEELTAQQTDDCEPRGDRYERHSAVRRIRGNDSLPLIALGDSATVRAAHAAALRQGFGDMTRAGLNCPEPSDFGLYDWGIARREDAWVPTVTVTDFGIRGQCQFTADLARDIPDSIGGDTAKRRWNRAWANGRAIVMAVWSRDAAESRRWEAAMKR